MYNRKLLFLLIPLLFLSFTRNAFAQNQAENARPKVAVILSGGSGKGFAHIGALRVIEKAGIKPDLIGGTSMGAVIAALYAIGYSLDDIEEIILSLDWDQVMSDNISRRELFIEEKTGDERYVASFPIKDGKIGLPSGLSGGQNLSNLLIRLTERVHHIEDFNDFQIPFFCVTTNIETGEQVILDGGYLPDALRASSSIPTFFNPVEIDGALYIDGGVVNNFPVFEARMKGAEIVIGSDVQSPLYEQEELNSFVRIMEQATSFANKEQNKYQQKLCDIIITPEIGKYAITDFDDADSIIYKSNKYCERYYDDLKALADSINNLGPAYTHPQAITPLDSLYIAELEIIGEEKISEELILGKLNLRVPYNHTHKSLQKAIDRVYGSQYFSSVNYKLTPVEGGWFKLTLRVKEKVTDKEFKVGLHYDSDFNVGVLLNTTFRNVGVKGSKFLLEGVISDNPRLWASYYIDRGIKPSLGIDFRSHHFKAGTYSLDREKIGSFEYSDYVLSVSLQSTFFNSYAIGFGAEVDRTLLIGDVTPEGFEDFKATFFNLFGHIKAESFNRGAFPTTGVRFNTTVKTIFDDFSEGNFEPVTIFNVQFHQAIPLGKRISLHPRIMGGATIGPDPPAPYQFYLGSNGENYIKNIMPFIGFNYMEIIGRNALIARLDLQTEIAKNHFITLKVNGAKTDPIFEKLFDLSANESIFNGYGISYGYNSMIGPIELTVYGSDSHDEIRSYISIGFWF